MREQRDDHALVGRGVMERRRTGGIDRGRVSAAFEQRIHGGGVTPQDGEVQRSIAGRIGYLNSGRGGWRFGGKTGGEQDSQDSSDEKWRGVIHDQDVISQDFVRWGEMTRSL